MAGPRVAPLLLVLLATCVVWLFVFIYLVKQPNQDALPTVSVGEFSALQERVEKLDLLVEEEEKQLKLIRDNLHRELAKTRDAEAALLSRKGGAAQHSPLAGAWPDPIPVLVFVCNRASAVRSHLKKLLQYRPSAERFPVVVSQDCDNAQVASAVQEFGDKVSYVKHISGAAANISVPAIHRQWTTYYRIARHYKLALSHVFGNLGHTSVIITEDDLDIAPDFFEYFSATRKLLKHDSSLWCVSAWNDNGKPELIDHSDGARLYRSDFFSGLGWMMSRDLWQELGPIWPAGFWDDWMRDPARRKNRTCIRPEISRTGMTEEGKSGASKGQFFNKHLAKVMTNTKFVNLTTMDLAYLKKDTYDREFHHLVYEESVLMSLDDAQKALLAQPDTEHKERPIRIEYNGNLDYIKKADGLHVMHDFKAGVPRTAYLGIVACFINGRRVYLAPDRGAIHGYDPAWHVPDGIPE